MDSTINQLAAQLENVTFLSTFVRLLLAAVFGGLIGIDRSRNRRAAGIRTFMLVSMGAALVMITNQYVAQQYHLADPTRLGAQVISGIGFLGVGTIIIDRQQQVRGLTTAAGLWACACMGLAIGIGFYEGAIIACVFILATIIILNKFERHILSKSRIMEIYIELDGHDKINPLLMHISKAKIKVVQLDFIQPHNFNATGDTRAALKMTLNLPVRNQHSEILTHLYTADGIIFIEEIQ